MDRLTKVIDGSVVFPSELVGVTLTPDNEIMCELLTRLAAYEDAMPLERVQALAQADQDGRLVVLPCKAGDTIYQLRDKRHARGAGISPRIVSYVGVWRQDYAAFHQGAVPCYKQDLGKTWFLTEEEAQVALEAAKTTKEEI